MAYLATPEKDPNARLDYKIDWTPWIIAGDTIAASTFTLDTGITSDLSSFTDTTTTVWLLGGTAGRSYKVVNHVTFASGRQDDRTLLIRVVQK